MPFLRKTTYNSSKWAIFSLFFCFIIFFSLILANNANAVIDQPVFQPPDGNTAGFLQISDINQAKSGPLRLGTSDVASPFNYQLEVLGLGADFSNADIENDLFIWDNVNKVNITLIVDSENNKVCIGPCLNVENSKLEVSEYGVIINNSTGTGQSLRAVSDGAEAIYGSGADGYSGIYGAAAADNYGIYAFSAAGVALEGENLAVPRSYSSVAGISGTGFGIFGTNNNYLGLWSAYFDGRLESNEDISGSKFLSTKPKNSLVSFTSGQLSREYNIGDSSVQYYDGTYLWITNNGELLKVRASDGFQVLETNSNINAIDVIYDSEYIWAVVEDGDKVSKINSTTGVEECFFAVPNPTGAVFTGTDYWIVSNDGNDGNLLKMNKDDCTQIGSTISLTVGGDFNLGKIIFDGSYLWILATEDTESGVVITVNPSSEEAMMWQWLIGNNPKDIFFDNSYYWVSSAGHGNVSRFYLREDRVCSELDINDAAVSCSDDSYCSNNSLGTCTFEIPQRYGEFEVSYDQSHITSSPTEIISDGNYLWVNNTWVDNANVSSYELVKMSMADPEQIETYSFSLVPTGLVYDGTYLWVSSSDIGLTKIFSGTGYGNTDLSRTLALQNNNTLVAQGGSFDIQGSGQFGDSITAAGDIISLNNVWGDGLDIIENGGNPLGLGIHSCPTIGYYITNIVENGSGEIVQIECRQL